MSKNTLNGTRKKVIKTSGFRARLATKNGKKILKNRRRKGRWNLAMKK
jgi:large subunit ribosomal protein L34|tara:strand:- start:381 stop:524 length:144 start_codon:yes stop_codon:yes gene_type:complete